MTQATTSTEKIGLKGGHLIERVRELLHEFVGRHSGPLVLPDGTELAATGKRVEMPGMEYVKVRDRKVVVDTLYYDKLAVAAQFGLLEQSVPATC